MQHPQKINPNSWEFVLKRTFKISSLATVIPNHRALERCKLHIITWEASQTDPIPHLWPHRHQKIKNQPRDSAPMLLFPLLVMDLFQNTVQSSPHPPVQAGTGLEIFPCLWDMAQNFALLRSDLRDPVA